MKRYISCLITFLLVTASWVMAATPPSGAIPATLFGMHVHQLSDWPANPPFGSYRQASNCGIWNCIATAENTYNWSDVDNWVNLVNQKNGIEINFVLWGTPQWASTQPNLNCAGYLGACAPPTNIKYWDEWVNAVATRYKGKIHVYELWNEADTSDYWVSDLPTLVTLAQHAYNDIKAIDPSAILTTPSIVNLLNGAGQQWLNNYFAAGGGQYADAVAFHGYWCTIYCPGWTYDQYITTVVSQLQAAMSNHGFSSKALFDTEAGWGTTASIPDGDKPGFVARYYLQQWSMGVTRFWWYAWDDTWGTMWTASTGEQPAATAYRQVDNWMVGATMTAPCSQASNGIWSCAFSRPGGYQALAIWNPTSSSSYTVASQYTQYRDLSGNTTHLPANHLITLTQQPILLENSGSTVNPSPNGTTIPPASSITDNGGTVWTLCGNQQICRNGTVDTITANVTLLLWWNGVIYQEINTGQWWSWNGSSWVYLGYNADPRPNLNPPTNLSVQVN